MGRPNRECSGSTFLPRDVPYSFLTYEQGAKFLETNTSGGFEHFHLETGDPALAIRIPEPTEVHVPGAACDSAPSRCDPDGVGSARLTSASGNGYGARSQMCVRYFSSQWPRTIERRSVR